MKANRFIIGVILILMIIITAKLTTVYVDASTPATKAENNGFYYIQHTGSGKYLDVSGGTLNNGDELIIYQKCLNHENQVFRFVKVGTHWKIIANHSQKVLDVLKGNKANKAKVAQWDYNGGANQLWDIVHNKDGTVSFKNVNSGKYLDVSGNKNKNCTPVIQYTSNGTSAQKFKLYKLQDKDILNASKAINLKSSDIAWTRGSINEGIVNMTRFNSPQAFSYPTLDKRYLTREEYIDAETVHNMLVKKSLNKSNLEQIIELAKGEYAEEKIGNLLRKMGYDVPYVGIALGIVETLATSQSKSDWNNFANTTRSGKGIIKRTYVKFVLYYGYGPLYRGSTAWGNRWYVKEVKEYTYSLWSGKGGVKDPTTMNGQWRVNFR